MLLVRLGSFFFLKERKGERKRSRATAWATLGVPMYLLLLRASALDYGSPLFYVITTAANSFWQLWPALKITEQPRSLPAGAISVTSFTPALRFASASVEAQAYLPLSIPPSLDRSTDLTLHLPHSWSGDWSYHWVQVSFMEAGRDNIVSFHYSFSYSPFIMQHALMRGQQTLSTSTSNKHVVLQLGVLGWC